MPTAPPVTPDWVKNPPTTLADQLALLKIKRHLLKDNTLLGSTLRSILKKVKETQQRAKDQAKKLQPLAFFKPSFEQSLILNSWIYGIGFVCIYSANRIGKTTAVVVNFTLWIIPNDPKWLIFKPYEIGDPIDDPENANHPHKGQFVQVLRRPDISVLRQIQEINRTIPRPPSVPAPNPRLSHKHKANRPYLQWLQKQLPPDSLRTTYPAPPWNSDGTVWFGGPDHDHFKDIIMPLWRQYLPPNIIERDVETSRNFTFVVPQPGSTIRKTTWEWIGKSYESKDTKWSSGAVDAILLTEGVLPQIWGEVKARFKDPSIGSHDFTPYEPANSGAATALAQKIKKGTQPVPLPHFVFDEFSVYNAPRQIMSEEKFNQLVTSYENTDEGKARLEGKFYASSALVLSNLDRSIHLLDWTIPELFKRFPTARLYRGIDPGLDHPTACAWGALLPTNQWVIYRILCQPSLSISQRAEKIVTMSNNTLHKKKWGPRPEDFYLEERHTRPNSEIIIASPIDYHVFKTDETTGLNYAYNYITAGLIVTESVHTGPEDRATTLDDLLRPSIYHPHLGTDLPPGPRVFFLRNSPGILTAFLKWEEYYWDRKRSGDDKGSPKDKVPIHGDDELDAVCYLTSSPFKWTNYSPEAKLSNDESEPEPILVNTSQALTASRSSQGILQPLQKASSRPAQRSQPVHAPVHFGNPNLQRETDDRDDDRDRPDIYRY